MKRILDSWPVACVRLLAHGAILVFVLLFLIGWYRGDPLAWTQVSSPQPGPLEEGRSAVGVLRMEVVVPRGCLFQCGLGADNLVVKTTDPMHVRLSVRREELPSRTVVSSMSDPHGQE